MDLADGHCDRRPLTSKNKAGGSTPASRGMKKSAAILTERVGTVRSHFSIPSSSTSKIKALLGPIFGPAPASP